MAEKIVKSGSETESIVGGGTLAVNEMATVDNRGASSKFMDNSKISTFNQNLLIEYLRYPTVLYEGSISTSTRIGATVYSSLVSPSLLNSTSLTRIANFATNFRQWNGSMLARFIFTKPIFLQTKIICAFIPGGSTSESENLTISDLYGAQYHAVINPDNESELSFTIPFISGYNWLNMNDSTGLFIVKLFQPLVASQPTGVANASIPFTVTISSSFDSTNSYDDCPLNFRYLVSPSYKNTEITKDLNEILYNSISPQVNTVFNNKYAGFIPQNMCESYIPKSAVFFPKTSFMEWAKIKYRKNLDSYKDDTEYDTAVASLDNSADKLYPSYFGSYDMPFKNVYLNSILPTTTGSYSYDDININLDINKYTYAANFKGQFFKFIYCSNLAPVKLGKFNIDNQTFILTQGSGKSHTVMFKATVTIALRPSGLFNYLIECSSSSYELNDGDRIDFSKPQNITYFDGDNFVKSNVDYETDLMYNAVVAAQNASGTHVIMTSRSTKSELLTQISQGNYSNMTLCNSDMFAASFSKRAIETSNQVNDGGERFNPVSVFFAIKYGVDLVAKASRFLSDVLTVLTPVFTMNSERIGPNSSVVFDLTIESSPLGYVEDTMASLRNVDDIFNTGIAITNIV